MPRPMAPSSPEFSLSSPSCSSRPCSLNRPMTTPDTSVWPSCGCSCSAARFNALCHQRNSLASSPGPLDTNKPTKCVLYNQTLKLISASSCCKKGLCWVRPGKDLVAPCGYQSQSLSLIGCSVLGVEALQYESVEGQEAAS